MLPELPGGIPSYSAIASIAMAVALLYIYFRLDKLRMTFKVFALYCLASAVFGILLAKIAFGLSILPIEGFTFHNFFYYTVNGGIVFYGGLFGVIIAILVVSHFLHRDGKYILDNIAPVFPLFHFIARFACLLGGCCYGIPWSWGVVMVDSPDIVRFPVQIAESICCLIIYIYLTIRAKRNNSYEGSFRLYMVLYACCRFVLEFFRGDTERGIWFLGISTSQIIAFLILFVIGFKSILSRTAHVRGNN